MGFSVGALLVALIPIIGWGLFPTISSALGGKPANQIFGATTGTLIFAAVCLLFTRAGFPGGWGWILGIISGMGWGFGQICAFKGYTLIGSSKVMPITTAFQLVVTALWGVFALGNWHSPMKLTIGLIALIVIILGATLTTWTQNKEKVASGNLKKAVILQLIGVIGYWVYSAAPHVMDITWFHGGLPIPAMNMYQEFLPQAAGMVIMAVVYGLTLLKTENIFTQAVSYKQMIAGLFFAVAAFAYLIASQNPAQGGIGLATAFVLSQVSCVVATLTGIWFLHQKKTPKEMWITCLGLLLIVGAAAVTAFL